MKTILFLANAGSIHTRRFAEHYRDVGVDVHIASFQAGDIPGVTVHRLPTLGLGRAGYVVAVPVVRSLAARIRPDVVNAHYITSYGVLGALAGLHPLVSTAWGSDVLLAPAASRMMRWLARFALQHADVVTTVAQHMVGAVAELGVPASRIHAVPFGVDVTRFVLGHQSGELSGALHVVCTRNFDPVYDVGTLLRAAAQLALDEREFIVDLAGHGPLGQELKGQAATLGISRICNFYGHLEHGQLAELLRRADVFVSPALSDGNNVSLNEAMACGAFPIATAIPANTQWIQNGVNGLLYRAGDADELARCLRQAFEDTGLRQRARMVNRDVVERRASWQACVRRMDEIFESAIRCQRGAAP